MFPLAADELFSPAASGALFFRLAFHRAPCRRGPRVRILLPPAASHQRTRVGTRRRSALLDVDHGPKPSRLNSQPVGIVERLFLEMGMMGCTRGSVIRGDISQAIDLSVKAPAKRIYPASADEDVLTGQLRRILWPEIAFEMSGSRKGLIMYVARFSYDVMPANRQQALDNEA